MIEAPSVSDEETPPTEETKPYEASTLGDYGYALPIGVVTGNPPTLEKGFAFRPYRMKEQLEIDKIRSQKGGAGDHPGKVVAEVLAFMLTEWGGRTDFQTVQQKHRVLQIEQGFMEDVLYAWICLRIEALGEYIGIDIKCLNRMCGRFDEYPFRADLRKLPVTVTNKLVEPHHFKLRHPITWGKKDWDTLNLLPPRWGACCLIRAGDVVGDTDVKYQLAISAVQSMHASSDPEDVKPVTGAALEQIHFIDTERLVKVIQGTKGDGIFPHGDYRLHLECPDCHTGPTTTLTWSYDFFFDASSLPRDMMT